MFFANDVAGTKTYIDDAEPGQSYFCPACGCALVQKRGNVNAHHFAHRVGKECDPWYTEKLSPWHIKMQRHFSKRTQEVIIWNEKHTDYHVADVLLQKGDQKYVIEFQHSSISQIEFLARTHFYIGSGYKIIWVFDFCECKTPKKIYVADTVYENNVIRFVWPGKDRIRFLDKIDFSIFRNNLYIAFHISTGIGKLQLHNPDGHRPWETWEFVNPFSRHTCFALLDLNSFEMIDDFFAQYCSEQNFFHMLNSLGK